MAATRLSHVDGDGGHLLIGGYAVEELAPNARFEEVLHLLWYGRAPTARGGAGAAARVWRRRASCPRRRWRCCARRRRERVGGDGRAAHGRGHAEPGRSVSGRWVARGRHRRAPSAWWRARRRSSRRTRDCGAGWSRLRRAATLGHAANYLYMLEGREAGARGGAGAGDLSQHGGRSRHERVDLHRPRHLQHALGHVLGGRRRARRPQRAAARRRARAGARHGVRDPRARGGERRATCAPRPRRHVRAHGGGRGAHHGVRPSRLPGARPARRRARQRRGAAPYVAS